MTEESSESRNASGLCARRACYAKHDDLKHRDTTLLYCRSCARKINEERGEELVKKDDPRLHIKHLVRDSSSHWMECAPKDENGLNLFASWAAFNAAGVHGIERVECRDCLDSIVRRGERAVARIVELDRLAGNLTTKIAMPRS